MEDKSKVAIIILNWNGLEDTVACLDSLKELEYGNYKVILVDNGSSYKEGEKLKGMFPYVHLIQNEKNRGFAGGNNDGITWAIENEFEYIVCLNNDCIVEKGWLSNLIDGLKSTDADFGSSRIMFYPDTNKICSDGDVLLLDGSAIAENRNKDYEANISNSREIFSACGAGAIYSSECLREVAIKENQFFDELYFAYYEDIDLGIRLKAQSYKGVLVPDAVVYHKHSKTAGEYSKFKIFNSEKNRILNEILNYPFYLIFAGELFFIFKLVFLSLHSVLNKKGKGYKYLTKLKVVDILFLFLKSRIWIIRNIRLIFKDRRERKARGFISSEILKYLCWNITKMIS